MDLSHYIKKSETARRTAKSYSIEKRCLECGKKLEKGQSPLYMQSFCSYECKDRYVNLRQDY